MNQSQTIEDGTKEGDKILSIKKILKNNNFIFKCNVIEECCSYETTLNFLDTIKNKSFREDVKKSDENDAKDDDENDEVSPIHLVKLIGRIIQNIIKSNSYNIEKDYDIKNGIKIIFDHDFLGCRYILNLKRDYFEKKYVNLEKTDLSSLVLHLLNENEELKKKIENQFCYEEISRIKFIESGLWTKSPFDTTYSTQDILDGKDNIKQWIFKKYKHPESHDKLNLIGMLKHSGIEQKNNVNKNMIFADNVVTHHASSKIYQHPNNDACMNSSQGIVLSYSKDVHLNNVLRLIKEYNHIYLVGKLYIKMDVLGGLLKKQNLTYNRPVKQYKKKTYNRHVRQINQTAVEDFINQTAVADFITLDSFNKFLFDKKRYVIGKVNGSKRNMESKYFIVSYTLKLHMPTMPNIWRNSIGCHHIKVVYQIKLNGGILTIHFIKAYQNSNNMECNDGYSGTVDQQPSLGVGHHTSVELIVNCTDPFLQLQLKLYNN